MEGKKNYFWDFLTFMLLLKVSKFQNEFMKSSFLQKYEPKKSLHYFAHNLGETMTS